MGHRKHSQPRRGSMAYSPRGRAKSMEARIRAWPEVNSDEPRLLAHAGFKAGCVQLVSVDDREHVPNYGKQVVTIGTVIVTPPLVIIGIRGYGKDSNGKHARFDVFTKDAPKNIEKLIKIKPEDSDLENAEKVLGKINGVLFSDIGVVWNVNFGETGVKPCTKYKNRTVGKRRFALSLL